ncbi:Mpo1-like protein, partial [Shewanella indica]
MKSAVEQLSTYKSVHLNPTNIKSHFIGIPLIIWSVFLMLSLWRLPFS